MSSLRQSDLAWIALASGVVSWNLIAKDGELLSEAVDRYMISHPWRTRAIIALVAIHLSNSVPPSCDPIHWIFLVTRKGVSRPTSVKNL